jgi:hypothetical protein
MDTIEIRTLVDITHTGVTRLTQGTQRQLDQNKNFITLTQCAEIRSIISYDDLPTREVTDVKSQGFGNAFKGKHAIWTFILRPDRSGVYINEHGDPVGCLIDDLNGVPIIKNLTETINISKAIFDLKDIASRNTIVKALPGTN